MYTKNDHILEYPQYKDVNEFKESLIHGREIVIKWNNVEYSIEYENNTMSDFLYARQTDRKLKSILSRLMNC